MSAVELRQLSKSYGPVTAVTDLDLAVHDGEFMVLVGPSGCGKSTVLRLIAGLEAPGGGEVLIAGQRVDHLPPRDRDVAMVFQSYALYPHMTVFGNLAFGLRLRRVPRPEIRRRVEETARILDLSAILERRPAALSGGQRQRVALGRAIVREPRVFLFDEPLSNLDARLRTQTRAELSRLHRRLGATMIYVTHDQVEAMTMGDRIAVMQHGRLQQVDRPLVLYGRPHNLFVASFIGSPAMNLLRGIAEGGRFRTDGIEIAIPEALRSAAHRAGEITFGIRPEHLRLATGVQEPGPAAGLQGRIELLEPLGADTLVHVRGAGHAVTVRVSGEVELEPEQNVSLAIEAAAGHFFATASEERLAPA